MLPSAARVEQVSVVERNKTTFVIDELKPLQTGVEPVRYRIDTEHGVVYIRLRGDLTFAALCATEDAYLGDPDYEPGMALYVDCRVLTAIPTREQIRKLALDRLFRGVSMPLGPLAIVVLTPLGVEFGRAWELFSDTAAARVRMFTSERQARDWLGVPAVPRWFDS
jgi:hypothetical protein